MAANEPPCRACGLSFAGVGDRRCPYWRSHEWRSDWYGSLTAHMAEQQVIRQGAQVIDNRGASIGRQLVVSGTVNLSGVGKG